jgi:hypothetical protein
MRSSRFSQRFGPVSGHDFSRAVNKQKELGFSPCGSSSDPNTLVRIVSELAIRVGFAVAGAKALIIFHTLRTIATTSGCVGHRNNMALSLY